MSSWSLLFHASSSRPQVIFVPSCVLAFWTMGYVARLVAARFNAVVTKQVNFKHYKVFNDDKGEPEALVQLGQHVENLFEAPSLFHAACVVLFVTSAVTTTTLALAWFYVVSRMVHSVIHTGRNNVLHRMLAYVASTVALGGLWACVLRKCLA